MRTLLMIALFVAFPASGFADDDPSKPLIAVAGNEKTGTSSDVPLQSMVKPADAPTQQGNGGGSGGQGGHGGGGQGGHGGGSKGGGKGTASQLSLPLSGAGLRGTFGGYRAYSASRSQAFYSLGYGGTSLFSHGTAFSGTQIGDADPIDFGGNPLDLELGKGSTKIGGTVVHNLNAIPLNITPLPMFKIT